MENTTKVCTICKTEKAIGNFGRKVNTKDGLSFWCRECTSIKNKALRDKKSEERLAATKIREEVKETLRQERIQAKEKPCRVCGKLLDKTLFSPAQGNLDGLANICKPCSVLKTKQYVEQYSDKVRASRKQHYQENKAEIAVKQKQFRIKNHDKIVARKKVYYQATREKQLAKSRSWRLANLEHVSIQKRNYRLENAERIKESKKNYSSGKLFNPITKTWEYSEELRVRLLSGKKEYYQINKENFLVKCKAYHLKNRDRILERKRIYWKTNGDKFRAKIKVYRATHKEEIILAQKQWRERNREHVKNYFASRYIKNKSVYKLYFDEYRKRNSAIIKERQGKYRNNPVNKARRKEYLNSYCLINSDKINKYHKEYNLRNAEKRKQAAIAWRKNNPERWNERSRRHRARKIGNGGSHTLQEWLNLKKKYDYTCLKCSKKEPGIKLTLDHVMPLVFGGTNSINNCQPLCASCNSSKNGKWKDYRPDSKTYGEGWKTPSLWG
jgi:5-methylcytosine-specific restriction endonuclease McrA